MRPPRPRARPTISSFTASQTTVTAGTPVILSWTVSNDSYDYIDAVGPVRGGTQTVTPAATTIYTLYSTNQYGRATSRSRSTFSSRGNAFVPVCPHLRASESCAINIESSLNNFCLPADRDFVFVRSTIVEF